MTLWLGPSRLSGAGSSPGEGTTPPSCLPSLWFHLNRHWAMPCRADARYGHWARCFTCAQLARNLIGHEPLSGRPGDTGYRFLLAAALDGPSGTWGDEDPAAVREAIDITRLGIKLLPRLALSLPAGPRGLRRAPVSSFHTSLALRPFSSARLDADRSWRVPPLALPGASSAPNSADSALPRQQPYSRPTLR